MVVIIKEKFQQDMKESLFSTLKKEYLSYNLHSIEIPNTSMCHSPVDTDDEWQNRLRKIATDVVDEVVEEHLSGIRRYDDPFDNESAK